MNPSAVTSLPEHGHAVDFSMNRRARSVETVIATHNTDGMILRNLGLIAVESRYL